MVCALKDGEYLTLQKIRETTEQDTLNRSAQIADQWDPPSVDWRKPDKATRRAQRENLTTMSVSLVYRYCVVDKPRGTMQLFVDRRSAFYHARKLAKRRRSGTYSVQAFLSERSPRLSVLSGDTWAAFNRMWRFRFVLKA